MMPPLLFVRRFEGRPSRRKPGIPPDTPAKQWWGRRRLRYNVALMIAGPLAFAIDEAVTAWGVSRGAIPIDRDPDSVICACFGCILYLFFANLCYFLGPFSEELVRPRNYDRYRRIAFGLGFWFSVLLPFSIPAETACFCLTTHSWQQSHG